MGGSQSKNARKEKARKNRKDVQPQEDSKLTEVVVPQVPGSLPSELKVVFVLGGPGSGKGTQCELIKRDYECVHLSAGDLLRDEVKSGSALGQQCEAIMKEGKLVPMEVIMGLLKNAMITSGGTFFLVDGFPRALDQAEMFEAKVAPCQAVIFFDCPEEEMERRLLKRGETSGRSDDNAETIRKRFKTFLEQSLPVKDHYLAQGKCHVISALDTPDNIYTKVQDVLEAIHAPKKQEVQKVAEASQAAATVTAAAAAADSLAKQADAVPQVVVPEVRGSLPTDTKILFVLGGPGSGKGTQCELIKRDFKCVHLSAGDLLRDEVKSGSTLGQQCEAIMKEGKLVPMEVIMGLLKNAMIVSAGSFFLIDGFPRALDQAEMFEAKVSPCQAVIFFDCPEEEMERRLLKRGETSGRSDDNAETIRKRFKTFLEQSLPVKDHYLAQGKCHVISAMDTPDSIYLKVQHVLDAIKAPRQPVAAAEATAPEAAPAPAPAVEELVVPEVPGSLPADAAIVFVLGGPGSGKGTQCDLIKRDYECIHLSAGDLLRAEVASGSSVGQKCEAIMREGKLVPVTVTLSLLKNAMISSGGSFFLIDGFPRALDQAELFESKVSPCQAVIFFDCPEEEMERRLLKRGETSGRSDDNAETIRKRFKTFLEQSLPVKDHYLTQGKCHVISALDTPDNIYIKVQTVLQAIHAPKKQASQEVEAQQEKVQQLVAA